MDATHLSCGVVLVAVVGVDEGIVVDYLATYPQQLGTFIIPWEDTDVDIDGIGTFAQLSLWCDEQRPVWIVADGDTIAVCSHSSSLEQLLAADSITLRRAAPDEQ
jgi:hypothetical protein